MSPTIPPAEACAAALTRLPGIGPARLTEILTERDPGAAWASVLAGETTRSERPAVRQERLLGHFSKIPGPRASRSRSWAEAAAAMEVEGWWQRASSAGVRVTWIGEDQYPPTLARDPQLPGVLFWRGLITCLRRPCVAIVGTRNASPEGKAVAFEMGRGLAAAGVCVVSGLALGIDGSAHRGALCATAHEGCDPAPPVGVAASGVDVAYPPRHASLWEQVAAAGVLISETPPGYPAQAWRFPSRNRVIAALSQMVVVVESHSAGGSLITAEAAIDRGVDVRVVPGPVSSPSCAGSNQLLYDGAGPVRCAQDVLDALGILLPESRSPSLDRSSDRRRRRSNPQTRRHGSRAQAHADLGVSQRAVLAAVGWAPSTVNKVAERSALGVTQVVLALEELSSRGLIVEDRGWWTRLR